MTNNDVLRRLRFALDLSDAEVQRLARLGDAPIAPEELRAWLCRDDDPDFEPCPGEVLDALLDGLILHRRGPRDPNAPSPPPPSRIDNNLILRKLRIALSLKDGDMLEILAKGGMRLSASELGALFRARNHPHYRAAGDQLLRNFLRGLTIQLRGVGAAPA